MLTDSFIVQSPSVKYGDGFIQTDYVYRNTEAIIGPNSKVTIVPKETKYTFKTETKVPRVG